jgi:pimeloyl-ACP methyl ester carboxylesterase
VSIRLLPASTPGIGYEYRIAKAPDTEAPSERGPGQGTRSPNERDELFVFDAADGRRLELIHVTGGEKGRGPVLLVHGAGVRANIFRPPTKTNLVEVLVAEGHDVWLLNWRASIDLPQNQWTLDQAAAFDHPAAVEQVLELSGADSLQAVVHCQGSTSFMMAAVAGLLPRVRTIVSNAVSLHPVIPTLARYKIRYLHTPMQAISRYINPQWGLEAPDVVASALVAYVKATHHECDNTVCRLASFTYGVGKPTLWSHELLSPATHQWICQEFGAVPITFFRQMAACVDAGQLISVDSTPDLPARFADGPPRTDARIVLLAGEDNRCFNAESQARTFDFLERRGPAKYELHVFPRYGHLDVFLGDGAALDIFPTIVAALAGD